MKTSGNNREEITQRALALPMVGDGELLNDARAEQILLDLRRAGSPLLSHLEAQIDQVLDELRPEWLKVEDGNYKLTKGSIVTMVARAVRRGAAQTASDVGETLVDISALEAAFAAGQAPEPPSAA